MNRCQYCGKEYPDEVTVCAIDGNPVGDAASPLPPATRSLTPQQAQAPRSVVSVIVFAVLSAFTGVGLASMAIATIANHMNEASGGSHVNPIVGGPGDAFVARSVPILFAGGLLGFVVGLVGKAISEKRKLGAQPGSPPDPDSSASLGNLGAAEGPSSAG